MLTKNFMIRFDKHAEHPKWFLYPRLKVYAEWGMLVVSWLLLGVSFAKRASDGDAANWNIED